MPVRRTIVLSSSDYVLISIETPPTLDLEAAELALALAAFDIPVKVVFRNQGLFWLLDQAPRKLGGKSAAKVLSSFALYVIEEMYAVENEVKEFDININDLPTLNKVKSNSELTQVIQDSAHYFMFYGFIWRCINYSLLPIL